MALPLALIRPGVEASSKPGGVAVSAFYYLTSTEIIQVSVDAPVGIAARYLHNLPIQPYRLAFSPITGRMVAACWTNASTGGMYYSDDFGHTWTKCPVNANWNANRGYLYVIYNHISNRFVGLGAGANAANPIVVSDDGINWRNSLAQPTGDEIATNYQSMSVNMFDGRCHIVTFNNVGGQRTFIRSNDSTMDSWSQINAAGNAVEVVGDGAAGQTYSFGGSIVLGGSAAARSIDSGATLIPETPISGTNMVVSQNDGRMFLANNGTPATLYTSVDGGDNWTALTGGAGGANYFMVGDPYNPRTIWINSASEVRLLTGGGAIPASLLTIPSLPAAPFNRLGCWVVTP